MFTIRLICILYFFLICPHHIYAEKSLMQVSQDSSWEKIFTKNGIRIFRADRKGIDLPLLKGEGILPLNLYELMAVVEDAKLHPQWVYRMKQSIIFERPDPFHLKAYVQFDFPWPASDRDSVLQVDVKRIWTPNHEVWISFRKIIDKRYPPQEDLVRVSRSRGYTRLRWLGPHKTHIVYVIDSDPGGNLPTWLIRWLSKDLPFKVIMALKKRVRQVKGQYEKFLNHWDPRRSKQKDAPKIFILPGIKMIPH